MEDHIGTRIEKGLDGCHLLARMRGGRNWPSDLLRGIDCYRPSEYGTVVLEIRLLVFTGKEGLGYVDIR